MLAIVAVFRDLEADEPGFNLVFDQFALNVLQQMLIGQRRAGQIDAARVQMTGAVGQAADDIGTRR